MKKTKKIIGLLAALALTFGAIGCSSDDGDNTGGGSDTGNSQATQNKDGTTTLKIEENGTGFTSTTGSVKSGDTNWIGYSGDGYVESLTSGKNVVYIVSAKEKITNAKIAVHYGMWNTQSMVRGVLVKVNGTTVNEGKAIKTVYTMKGTKGQNIEGRWIDSGFVTDITLNAGSNEIIIEGATGSQTYNGETYTPTDAGCLPNIDYLIVNGKDISAGGTISESSYYTLSYNTENPTAGSVESTTTNGSIKEKTSISLTATPNTGWIFECWSDGTTANPYTFSLEKDTYLFAHFIPSSYNAPTTSDGYMGYATVTSDSATAYTISGGAGGTEITISSLEDMETYKTELSKDVPYIVKVTGLVTTSDNVSVYYSIGSNKTIYSPDGTGRFKNVEVRVQGANVIIRNLTFGEVIGDDFWNGKGNDSLALNGARHVWVDHCEFQSHLTPQNNDGTALSYSSEITNESDESDWKKDFYDGLLDIKNGGTWITISNCYFHDHWKACLCGSGDDGPDVNTTTGLTDEDMRVTFFGNYWLNINSRQPLFRYGTGHILSNYFYGNDGASCINVRAGSKLYIEGNSFNNIKSNSSSVTHGTYTIGFYFTNSKKYGNTSGSWKALNNSSDDGSYGSEVSAPAYTYTAPTSYPTSAPTDKGATLTGLNY